MKELVYTDGSIFQAKANSGGAAVYFKNRDEWDWSPCIKNTTINRMELLAIFMALNQLISDEVEEAIIYSDSQYSVNTLTKFYRKWARQGTKEGKQNLDLIERIMEVYTRDIKKKYKIVWIKGHSGIDGNEKADGMAQSAALSDNVKYDDRETGLKNVL